MRGWRVVRLRCTLAGVPQAGSQSVGIGSLGWEKTVQFSTVQCYVPVERFATVNCDVGSHTSVGHCAVAKGGHRKMCDSLGT